MCWWRIVMPLILKKLPPLSENIMDDLIMHMCTSFLKCKEGYERQCLIVFRTSPGWSQTQWGLEPNAISKRGKQSHWDFWLSKNFFPQVSRSIRRDTSHPSTQKLSSICLSPSYMTNETIPWLQRICQK